MKKGKKRKNPITGKPFVRGEKREDGYVFYQYKTQRPLKKDGSYQESWMNPTLFKQSRETKVDVKKRKNPKTKRIWKRGEIRERDRYIFSHYRLKADKSGYAPMVFLSPIVYAQKLNNEKIRAKNKYNESRLFEGNKRLNPKTGKPFVQGDIREDDYIFDSYNTTSIKNDGFYRENWLSKASYQRSKITKIVMNTRLRSKQKKINSNLTVDYCLSIFPKDNKCPVLGITLNWGGRRTNGDSPSLDRIHPKKGYVKGNVMWMSQRANSMKSNANDIELKKFARWINKNFS